MATEEHGKIPDDVLTTGHSGRSAAQILNPDIVFNLCPDSGMPE